MNLLGNLEFCELAHSSSATLSYAYNNSGGHVTRHTCNFKTEHGNVCVHLTILCILSFHNQFLSYIIVI